MKKFVYSVLPFIRSRVTAALPSRDCEWGSRGSESVWSLAKLAYGLVIHSPLHEAVPPRNLSHFATF